MTKEEWENMLVEFNYQCVRCGLGEYHLDRDHIVPKYQGGSDDISNRQPLCAWCNSSKGPENFNWKELRRQFGWFNFFNLKLSKNHPLNK